jgi:hypothetical protein
MMAVKKQPPHVPNVLAMILADAVLRDLGTNKNFIQGTFHVLAAPSFPWTHPSMVVYLVLTDGHGAIPLKLRLVDVDESSPAIFEVETTVNFPDPLLVLELVFPRSNIVFPEPGEYRVQLFGAGEPLLERRLNVVLLEDLDSP